MTPFPAVFRADHVSNRSLPAAALTAALGTVLYLATAGYLLAGGLNATQQRTAKTLANDVPWGSERISTESHPLGLQTLSIEIQEQKTRAAIPLIRVYQYHYNYQSARMLVFDLTQSKLISEKSIDTVHLPLNEQEIQMAGTLLSRRDDLLEQLRDEQTKRGKAAFQQLTELDAKASIFEPADSLHPCARQRCALMTLFDKSRTVFSIEPVIYLQALRVELLELQ